MKKLIFLPLLLISCCSLAQHTPNNILDIFVGNWHANGAAFGMPANITMNWTPVLETRFYRLQYKIITIGKDSTQMIFEGIAYYKPLGENRFAATWFDTQGSIHPIIASNDTTTLTSLWGTPETQQGKTTYKIINTQEIEVTDFIMKKDGAWNKFNQNTLIKSR
ncbi:MAG: hypothetical protein KIT80_05295 [Chitinophagaceae bacterium]|nr:hypothetical protein [Chitinophagaceae bacterium]MCW5926310.1 hypothetical protein [Chitinophagaceae bacterium]